VSEWVVEYVIKRDGREVVVGSGGHWDSPEDALHAQQTDAAEEIQRIEDEE
jgi:hypothetical protein